MNGLLAVVQRFANSTIQNQPQQNQTFLICVDWLSLIVDGCAAAALPIQINLFFSFQFLQLLKK